MQPCRPGNCDELLDNTKSMFDRGKAWAMSEYRPRIREAVVSRWDALIEEWSADKSQPLLIRLGAGKKSARGSIIRGANSRVLVPTDNSPAQWVFAMAANPVQQINITLSNIRSFLEQGKIPIAFALKTTNGEKANAVYRGILGKCPNTLTAGWYLAHINQIGKGLFKGCNIATCDPQFLEVHFKKFMSPSNMFVIQKGKEYNRIAENADFLSGFVAGTKIDIF